MYSIVLMMAMTSAPETPEFHGVFHGGALHYWNSCHGCGGSFWHSSCNGCYSSGHGHGWAYSSRACSGCCGNVTSYHSCSGYAPNYYQPFSCFGYGIYGGTSYYWPTPYDGGGPGTYGVGTPYVPNSMPRIEDKKEELKKDKIDGKTMIYPTVPTKASVVVRLPADAKLYANNSPTNLNSAERQFSTPTLEKGQDYQYTMKIEYSREGKTVVDSQIVKVRAGEVSVVEFVDKAATLAVSTIKFATPEGAAVFVENKPLATAAGEFKTPELTKGAEYAYSVRAEITVNGKTETATQRVVFKAGEPVTVDFSDLGTIRTASK